MAIEKSITQAQNIIGLGQDNDHAFTPSKHAETFQATAPELAALLSNGKFTMNCKQYDNENKRAVAAQTEFRAVFNRANLLVMITAMLTALILTVGVVSNLLHGAEKILVIVFSAGSVITGALASKDLYTIRQGGLLEAWMKARAEAESKRLSFFEDLAKADMSATDGGVPTGLLKLEYFRRYQLDVQLAFFTNRAATKEAEAKKSLRQSSYSVAGAAIVAGLAGVLTTINTQFAAIASLGALFTAFSSYLTLKEQIFQNQRIAERYKQTDKTIEELYTRLDDVRKAVLANGQEPLLSYVAAVHDVLLAEHKQWLGDQQGNVVITALDEALKKALAPSNQQQPPPPAEATETQAASQPEEKAAAPAAQTQAAEATSIPADEAPPTDDDVMPDEEPEPVTEGEEKQDGQ